MAFGFIFKTISLVLTLVASANAQPGTVKLTHPDLSSAEVSLFGAQVLSFRSGNDPTNDVLFTSNDSFSDPRAGISIMFPNVDPTENLLYGGLARRINWKCDSYVESTDTHTPSVAIFSLSSGHATRDWPYDFKLTYKVKLYANKLKTLLYVDNTFSKTISFEAMLYNLFRAENVRNKGVRVKGLKGANYQNFIGTKNNAEDRDYIDFPAETKSLYVDSGNEVSAIIASTNAATRTVTISNKALITRPDSTSSDEADTDLYLYTMKDVPPESGDDNKHMFVISPCRMSEPQDVAPGQRYVLQQTISVEWSKVR